MSVRSERPAASPRFFIQRARGPAPCHSNGFYIPTSGLRISTSSIVVTMIFRKRPRGSSESISRLISCRGKGTPDEQWTLRLLNPLKIRNHFLEWRTTDIVVDFKALNFLNLQEGFQQEHRRGVQMNETVGKLTGKHAVHRLDEFSIESRRIDCRGIFLHPNDRSGRPERILSVKISAME